MGKLGGTASPPSAGTERDGRQRGRKTDRTAGTLSLPFRLDTVWEECGTAALGCVRGKRTAGGGCATSQICSLCFHPISMYENLCLGGRGSVGDQDGLYIRNLLILRPGTNTL